MRNNLVDISSVALAAAIEATLNFSGEQFYLESAASPVDVLFIDDTGGMLGRVSGVKTGFNVNFAGKGRISGIKITSSVAQIIRVAVADGSINFNAITGTINAINQQATTIANAVYPIGLSPAILIAADNNRKSVIFAIDPTTASGRIAIGGSGVNFSNAAIILDSDRPAFIDTTSAAALRYAVAENAGELLRVETSQ